MLLSQRIVGVVCGLLVGAQMSGAAAALPDAPENDRTPVTLSGCIGRDEKMPGAFTLSDPDTRMRYRLTGASVRKYAGRRVELVGGPTRRLTIRGGLVPSPNVAAQAGAMDPVMAAMATLPGGPETTTGDVLLPEVHVARVRSGAGSCQ